MLALLMYFLFLSKIIHFHSTYVDNKTQINLGRKLS